MECLIPASDLGAEDSFELEFSKFEALSPIPPLPPDYLAGEGIVEIGNVAGRHGGR